MYMYSPYHFRSAG